MIKYDDTLNGESEEIPYIKKNISYRESYLNDGDIVIADTAEDETVGKAIELYNITTNIVSGLHTIPCRPKVNFYSGYLGYYLNSFAYRKQLLPLMQGIKVLSLSKTNISKTLLRYPDILEQEKIANMFNLINKKISLQKRQIELLKSYKRGVLFNIFGDKSSNIKLDSLLQIGKAGGTPKSTTAKYYNGNIPFLNISDMTNQGKYIYTTTRKITEAGIENSSAWLVPKNSIILSMYASYGFVSINKIELATSQAMFSMVPNKEISYSYLYHYLNYLSFTNIYERMVSTGTQPNLNAEKIKNIPIYLPTFDKQNFITTLLDLLDDYIYKQEEILKKTNDLKTYLLQKLFI